MLIKIVALVYVVSIAQCKIVDADFVPKQQKVLSFFENVGQINPEAEYYQIGEDYDVEANIGHYTDKDAVEEFLVLLRSGFLTKFKVFSVFYERMREEAIAIFRLFYYAKDFDTFYKTAAYARVHFNAHQVLYAIYIAVFHRHDTQGIVLPAPYEAFPEFFSNTDTVFKTVRNKMQEGIMDEELARDFGIVKENDTYVFYSNYSNFWTYGNEEHSLSYFTEDIGLNSCYFYFHTFLPFWMNGDKVGILKERRGEVYFHFHQRLLARYYLERLVNGIGEIPEFSWYTPIKTGYTPFMATRYYTFIQRNEYYLLNTEKNVEEIQFLDTYEKTFIQFLLREHFNAYNQEVDLPQSTSINFVGNYWEGNADLYERSAHRKYVRSYEIIARRLLSAAPEVFDKYNIAPSALDFYATSLRDPVFYQLGNKILKNILQYKEYLEPYTPDNLHYVGVNISDVNIEQLVTSFDTFEYDGSNLVLDTVEELSGRSPVSKIRQPRLNHKAFKVDIEIRSDIEGEAVFKIFLGPKYDSKGFLIALEDNWMNFIELDQFVHILTPGLNNIERSSDDFFHYKEESISTTELLNMDEQTNVPFDMSEHFADFPKRLMLPKGLEGGFPIQFFVFVYPYQNPGEVYGPFIDTMPFGYPLDRRVGENFVMQPNMCFQDEYIYHEGEHFPNNLNSPYYVARNCST